MQRSKKEMLEKQFLDAAEKLEADMVQAVLDYESEINRRGMVQTVVLSLFVTDRQLLFGNYGFQIILP